jgi:LuxR family quorum-sensing system transcriptional regulator CciR
MHALFCPKRRLVTVHERRYGRHTAGLWQARESVMLQFPELDVFIGQANAAGNLKELSCIVDDMTRHLGFEYFALGYHARVLSDNLFQISNYPISWAERFVTRGYLSDDPAVVACQKTIVGFLWSDMHRLITLSERQKIILAESRSAGLGEGFTVPAHLPGECAGSCNFVTAPGRSVQSIMLPAAQYVGCMAFEAARRLVRNGKKDNGFESKQTVPRLTSRQLDCIVLAARGKSDTDAGQLLGISNQTVHQHIETAKRRYGVATRAQLIVYALFDSQLAFQDVLHH